MSRVTERQLKEWLRTYNDNWTVQMKLSVYSGYYHILEADTGSIVAVDKSPSACWEIFCAWKSGYCKALELVRKGEIDPNA